MCEPMMLIGAALSAAGTFVGAQQQQAFAEAQANAQRQAAELSRQARLRELERQQQFEKEATSAWDKSAEGLTKDRREAQQNEAQQQFVQNLDKGTTAVQEGQYLSGNNQAATEVQTDIARRVTEGAREARQRAMALARLSAYGTVDTANNNFIGNTNNNLQTLNGLRRGSLGVSQFEQAVPVPTVTPGSSALGDILSGFGGLALRGAGRGFGGFGAGATTGTGGLY